jgi:hypothetical protein
MLWERRGAALREAQEHFAIAIRSDRGRKDVRSKQVAAIGDLGEAYEPEYVRVLTDMRKAGDAIDETFVNRLRSIYWSACRWNWDSSRPDRVRFDAIRTAVPLEEHLANFEALATGAGITRERARERDASAATLLEHSGRLEDALQRWRSIRGATLADEREWLANAETVIKRLTSATGR